VPRVPEGWEEAGKPVATCRACNVIKSHRTYKDFEEAKAYVLKRRVELRQEWRATRLNCYSQAMTAT
jgi:hypothetical protein